jgi:D-amino-acid dehydrogenase
MAQMLRNCTASRYAVNKERMVRLSEYSRDCLDELRAETGIAYEGRSLGTTQLFRTQAQLDAAAKDIAVLSSPACRTSCSTATALPASSRPWPASPTSSPAPCACRTTRPATASCSPPSWPTWPKLGVEFRFGQDIQRLDFAGDRINGVWIDGKLETADRYVLALGSYSPQLLKPLGIKAPVYPLKGYSLTVPITNPTWRRPRPFSTRPTRSRSPVSTTASASAAWLKSPVLTCR